MEPINAFFTSLGLVVALSLVVVWVLRRSLSELLTELCGNDRRARFWTVFSVLGVVLMSVECALLSLPRASARYWSDVPELHLLFSGVRAGVFGLLMSFAILGSVLLLGVLRHEAGENASR
jgi:hypothetical protein